MQTSLIPYFYSYKNHCNINMSIKGINKKFIRILLLVNIQWNTSIDVNVALVDLQENEQITYSHPGVHIIIVGKIIGQHQSLHI